MPSRSLRPVRQSGHQITSSRALPCCEFHRALMTRRFGGPGRPRWYLFLCNVGGYIHPDRGEQVTRTSVKILRSGGGKSLVSKRSSDKLQHARLHRLWARPRRGTHRRSHLVSESALSAPRRASHICMRECIFNTVASVIQG